MPRLLVMCLGKLSVSRKLLLIFLLDMSAVAFISGILVNEKFLSIDFARKELSGSAYVAALREPLLALASEDSAEYESGAMERHVQDVQAAEARRGKGMDSSESSSSFVQALYQFAADPSRTALRHSAFERGRELLTRIGNQSNLILDPDLDTYYTMSIIVLRMPELLGTVAAITDQIQHLPSGETADIEGAKARFLLLEGRLDAVGESLESDYSEAFAASSPAVKLALGGSRIELLAAMQRYRSAAKAAVGPGAKAADFSAMRLAHRHLLTRMETAWRLAAHEMDRLLQARVEGFYARMWLHLGTALGFLVLILSAVFFVARQIALPMKQLSAVIDKVRLTGNQSIRAHWESWDEIGRVVAGFNEMLLQLDRQREVQQELVASTRAAQAQQQVVEAIPIPLMVTAIPGHQVLHANGPARAWLGDCVDDPWRVGLQPSVRARFFQQLADREEVNEFEVEWMAGPEPSWALLSARRLDFQGHAAVLTAFAPINHLKQMERRLELWAKVFEASGEGIVIVDADHQVVSVNRAFCRSTLYETPELVGQPLSCVEDVHGVREHMGNLWPLCEKRSWWQGEVIMRRRDGTAFPAWMMLSSVREGLQAAVSHTIVTTIDITDRKLNEERIQFLAHHDVLTELPNRSLCSERLRLAMQLAQRRGEKVAVLLIDLDRFKNVNDSLGHHVGDALLRSVARRLQQAVRASDTVSRLGGDEFVVVLGGVSGSEEIASLVERRLMPLIRTPHDIDGAELHVSCSIGIAVYPDDATDLDELMRHADAAMYHIKGEGRDGAHFFTAELNERAQRRLMLESGLRHAAERGEFSLHFQPRVHAHTGRVVGVEALLRWTSAELGSVSPASFIPVAEEAGLISGIGSWVLEAACRQYAEWRAKGIDVPQVSVNVSPLQLRDGALLDTLRSTVERHAIAPGALELELTESTLMEDAERALVQLRDIKSLGIELAIDDFGTGYSSLNYLNRFPIDRLKIDRSFVRDMLEDPTDFAITRAIIGLGHTLGLKVVAEGVETEREAQALRASECDEFQGYLFARPMAAEQFSTWMSGYRLCAA
ncbi:MAG TPA: EAL domain-containing protein [Burkholderiaceae bacterium]|nr:EAL domain-containing protein [Burkholderiaceae bacterium]